MGVEKCLGEWRGGWECHFSLSLLPLSPRSLTPPGPLFSLSCSYNGLQVDLGDDKDGGTQIQTVQDSTQG